jgi:hypothetical protein
MTLSSSKVGASVEVSNGVAPPPVTLKLTPPTSGRLSLKPPPLWPVLIEP